ncbi:DedA family protein [Corynebacterium aquilae]|uniref:DedA family protein n=1 Tax=Corynebacterium aquilae TaxID=203263 RepID=UPI00095358AF|nr:VTT domain-containing protein [Corynebacterium aquilae]
MSSACFTDCTTTITQVMALGPDWMDPMYLLSGSGPFGNFILPAVFTIVFIESGLLFPLLPGDSLLFTAGMLSSQPDPFAPLWQLLIFIPLASFLGDQSGYWIGRKFGEHLQNRPDGKIFKKEYLEESHAFFEKHGPITVIICRFVPIVRTYAPLVAGMSRMDYRVFFPFSIAGALIWGAGVTLLGSWLGQYQWVADNIDIIFISIVLVSIMPGVIGAIKGRKASKKANSTPRVK